MIKAVLVLLQILKFRFLCDSDRVSVGCQSQLFRSSALAVNDDIKLLAAFSRHAFACADGFSVKSLNSDACILIAEHRRRYVLLVGAAVVGEYYAVAVFFGVCFEIVRAGIENVRVPAAVHFYLSACKHL